VFAYLTSYIGRFVNANSRINGGELEVQWQPLQGLSISQYAGYTVGYYESHVLNSNTPGRLRRAAVELSQMVVRRRCQLRV
jgi:outer membrane receptor protein involved in Fe transport